jgi:hypothetical protein
MEKRLRISPRTFFVVATRTLPSVPSFMPILARADLPQEGPRPRELYTRDFKETMSHENLPELAKDIAAFANALGGSLIVGTNEDCADTLSYSGISKGYAEKLVVAVASVTTGGYLSPQPIVEPVTLVLGSDSSAGRTILVVNVWPYPDQPVGARSKEAHAWRFPLRVGDQTRFLEPAMLPMLTNARVRRTVILLESIPAGEQGRTVEVVWRHPGNRTKATPQAVFLRIVAVEPENNRVILEQLGKVAPEPQAIVPLEDVDAVWQSAKEAWAIRVTGHFEWPRYHSNPSNYPGY